MPPLIGITAYGPDEKGKIYLPAAYVDSVRLAGGIPVLLPRGEAQARDLLEKMDGLILSGGGDIDPALYGGARHETIYNVFPERDSSEISLAREGIERGFPTLGICRGCQVINVALGGTLIEHIPDHAGEKVLHRTPDRDYTRHAVALEEGSNLARVLLKTKFDVASSHHQSVRAVADGLRASGRSPDGIVEAVELPGHPWLFGVQWHPEVTAAEDPVQLRLFQSLVEAAERR